MSKYKISRPSYTPYLQEAYKGNKFVHNSMFFLYVLTLFSIILFYLASLIEVFKTDMSLTGITTNLFMMFVEFFTAFYSATVLWNFGRRYLPVDSPPGYKNTLWKLGMPLELYPHIAILIPVYKESKNVLTRTIASSLDINYPREKYDVIVLEDGVEKSEIAQLTKEMGAKYIHRKNRDGFKAGSINNAINTISSDFVFLIDADHIIEKNALLNALNAWRENTIAVQLRIDFVNIHTFLTYIASFLQIQFFSYFERARRQSGSAIFAGGAALFDRKLLLENGGMNTSTIADDTDTSYILISRGYRIEYLDKIGVWGLVPWEPLSLVRQIWRWFTGTTKSWTLRWRTILTGRTSIYVKIDHFFSAFFPLMTQLGWLMSISYLLLLRSNQPYVRYPLSVSIGMTEVVVGGAYFLLLLTIPMIIGVIVFLEQDKDIVFTKKPLAYKIAAIIFFYTVIYAANPLLLIGVIKGLIHWNVEFNRTPKDKEITDPITRHKIRYLIYTIVILIIGILSVLFIDPSEYNDPRASPVYFLAINAAIPFLFAVVWYSKLEAYIEDVADISTDALIKEELL